MGYRDSDDSGFSRHGMGRDHDEGRHAEHAHRGSMDRDDQRPGHAAELDGQYGQYGMVRNDYRGDAGLGLPPREGRDRFSSPDWFRSSGGYRNDGREVYPSNSRFDSDYGDYRDYRGHQDRDRAGYARGDARWDSGDGLRGPPRAARTTTTPTTSNGGRNSCACWTRTTNRGARTGTRNSPTTSIPGALRATSSPRPRDRPAPRKAAAAVAAATRAPRPADPGTQVDGLAAA
jgi:hypothetical protein